MGYRLRPWRSSCIPTWTRSMGWNRWRLSGRWVLWAGLGSMEGRSLRWQFLGKFWRIKLSRVFMKSWRSSGHSLPHKSRSSNSQPHLFLRKGSPSTKPNKSCSTAATNAKPSTSSCLSSAHNLQPHKKSPKISWKTPCYNTWFEFTKTSSGTFWTRSRNPIRMRME